FARPRDAERTAATVRRVLDRLHRGDSCVARYGMTGYQQILNMPWPSSLDSFEGVPDIFEPRVKPEERGRVGRLAHEALGWIGGVVPGVGLAFALAWLGYLLSEAIGAQLHFERGKSPVSPITL